MTLRGYCEQMGLCLKYKRVNGGWACAIQGFLVDEERIPSSASGPTKRAARNALVSLIAGHIIRSVIRETYLLWVPKLEKR
jgi:hypothetical protein